MSDPKDVAPFASLIAFRMRISRQLIEELRAEETRYTDHPDRLDLVICDDCTSRNHAVAIPRDEIRQHDNWHATDPLILALGNVFRFWV